MTEIKLLIVEDDPKIAEIHKRFAEKVNGFEVVGTATSVDQAKDWIEVMQPELILLDVYLPDQKGTDFIPWIRQYFKNVDIILITAASEMEVVRSALHGGVFDYIVKPLTFDRFKQSLENYLAQQNKWKEAKELTTEQIESLWNSEEFKAFLAEQDQVIKDLLSALGMAK